jgi:hypothetical protein
MKLAAVLVLLAATQAPAPSPRPVPLAANTLANKPDAYYGQVVSITAAVDRLISPTAFVLDQDPAKSTPQEILVIVSTLNGRLDPGMHVTVVGEAVRFDAADIARRMKDARPELGPEAIARYEGRPVILATAVLNAALVDFARRVVPPMTAEEEAFDKAMKRIGPAFNSLRTAAGASDATAAIESTKILKAAFADADVFWKGRAVADATDWNRTARAHVTVLEKALGAGKWDQVKTSLADVNRMCTTCHTAYRERLEDGTYRVKSAPAR